MNFQTWEIIAGLLGSALGGGAISAIVSAYLKRGEAKDDKAFSVLMAQVENLQKENDRLRKEVDELKKREDQKDEEMMNLKLQMMSVQMRNKSINVAMFRKNKSLIVTEANDKYVHNFLTPRGYQAADYIGKDDFAVWPQEIAEAYRKNDRKVMRTGKAWLGLESVQTNGDTEEWVIVKMPDADGTLGFAFAVSDLIISDQFSIGK